jgi:hypothetical protein
MPSLKHTHSYVRYKSRPGYYRCANAHCSHFAEKEVLVGKACTCTCGKEFILDREDLRRARPKCLECSNTAKSKIFKASHDLVKGLMEGLE